MLLTVLGSSGTYPTPGHPASGYLIRDGETALWVDAGSGTFAALQQHLDPARLTALVLTHGHADHCVDFFSLFNMLRRPPGREEPTPVLAPPGVAERLASFAGAGPGHDLHRVFRFEEAESGGEALVGSIALRFGAASHPVPAVSVRAESGGVVLAYSGDTGPGGGLVSISRGAGALVCEATFQGGRTVGDYPFHLFAAEAGAVAAEAGVERLLITHIAPGLDPRVSVAEASAAFGGPVEWAVPGMEVRV